jgi:hypothetical protein
MDSRGQEVVTAARLSEFLPSLRMPRESPQRRAADGEVVRAEGPPSVAPFQTAEALAAACRERDAAVAEVARLEGELAGAIEQGKAAEIAARNESIAAWAVKVVDDLTGAIRELERSIADQVAEILRPFLAGEAQKKAIEGLASRIGEIVAASSAATIKLKGPRHLIDALAPRLGELPVRIIMEEAEKEEVIARIDQTLVSTQLAAWRETALDMHSGAAP